MGCPVSRARTAREHREGAVRDGWGSRDGVHRCGARIGVFAPPVTSDLRRRAAPARHSVQVLDAEPPGYEPRAGSVVEIVACRVCRALEAARPST